METQIVNLIFNKNLNNFYFLKIKYFADFKKGNPTKKFWTIYLK